MVHLAAVSIGVFLLALLATGRTYSPSDFICDSNNQFALALYQAIRNNTGNIIASPICLKSVLGLILFGAQGATAAEIAKVLHHPRDDARVLEAYGALIHELQDPVLKMATNIFEGISSKINSGFLTVAFKYFMSNVQWVNFRGDPEGARNIINAWVQNHTNNKIKNLFNSGSLSPDTKLLLVSAIHFKAKWKHQFNERDTKDAPFYTASKQTVKVKMMSLLNKDINYKNSTRLGAQIVELPYLEEDYKMKMILPYDYDGLSKIESKQVSPAILAEELQGLLPETANVQLPKFKLENQLDLEPILKKLGMTKAFSYQAEFSKISNEPLKIDKVVQKAFIEVNEVGTEASAATGISLATKSDSSVNNIIFNHPFIFLVMKNSTILFMGRFSKPE